MTTPPCTHVGVILLRLDLDRWRCLTCGAEVPIAEEAPVRGGNGSPAGGEAVGRGNVPGETRPSTTGPRGA